VEPGLAKAFPDKLEENDDHVTRHESTVTRGTGGRVKRRGNGETGNVSLEQVREGTLRPPEMQRLEKETGGFLRSDSLRERLGSTTNSKETGLSATGLAGAFRALKITRNGSFFADD